MTPSPPSIFYPSSRSGPEEESWKDPGTHRPINFRDAGRYFWHISSKFISEWLRVWRTPRKKSGWETDEVNSGQPDGIVGSSCEKDL
jgi:hypothetical protein